MALTQAQHDSIMRVYSARQSASQRQNDARINEVYSKDQEFINIDNAIADAALYYGRNLLMPSGKKLPPLGETLNILKKQRLSLLASYGYPSDYLDPVYQCSDCKDTGYIDGHKCHCYLELATRLQYENSNLKNISPEDCFDNFDLNYYGKSPVDSSTGLSPYDSAQLALKKSKLFIDSFDTSFNNIFLYGSTGVGKTFLSNCIAKELLSRNKTVIYLTSFELFDALAKSTFNRQRDDNIHGHIFECDLLIIDDLGTELTNSFVSSQLFQVVNERILRRKSTIISTNLSVNGFMQAYSERTFSRISSSYTLIKLTGDDIRIKKALR